MFRHMTPPPQTPGRETVPEGQKELHDHKQKILLGGMQGSYHIPWHSEQFNNMLCQAHLTGRK